MTSSKPCKHVLRVSLPWANGSGNEADGDSGDVILDKITSGPHHSINEHDETLSLTRLTVIVISPPDLGDLERPSKGARATAAMLVSIVMRIST